MNKKRGIVEQTGKDTDGSVKKISKLTSRVSKSPEKNLTKNKSTKSSVKPNESQDPLSQDDKKDMNPRTHAWIIGVDMGYGHMRAAYPMESHAYKRIITANNDPLVPEKEKKTWIKYQSFYENISRLNEIPGVGSFIFGIYDKLQNISPFFPFRDLSKPSYSVIFMKNYIAKKQLCKNLIDNIKKTDLPVIATHFIPALACEYAGIKNPIYCVITDTDLNRVWVSDKPKESRIIYLAPCRHVVVRLRQYGVPEDKIVLTGFPLPKDNLGGEELRIAKYDIGNRLPNLDPKGKFREMYKEYIERAIGKKNIRKNSDHPLTITYLVGGAGAQKNVGVKIIKSLKAKIAKEELILNLVAGSNQKIYEFFKTEIAKAELTEYLGKNVFILYREKKNDYFAELPKVLRKTDIIWTKPSEMSFYTSLGLPVIMTTPLGSHEKFNKEWLEHVGSGIEQEAPEYVNDWLFYWIEEGRFAEACIDGFKRSPNNGIYNIEKEVFSKNKSNIRAK